MIVIFLLAVALFSTMNALNCVHDGTISNIVYDHAIIVSSFSHYFDFGYQKCSAKLDRCVSFKSMSITTFTSLDVGKDNSDFSNLIRKNEGRVRGRCCMSQADVEKIQAKQATKCTEDADTSCYCTTDECTGSANGSLTIASLLIILPLVIYS